MAIYREYDIRGIVGKELTAEVAGQIGRAFATMGREKGVRRVSLGRDGRTSSPLLHEHLLQGMRGGGLDVVDVGICPTPVLYFSLFRLSVDGGIMITGSHNPAEYNGFKICIGKDTIYGEEIQHLRALVEKGSFCSGSGALTEQPIIPDYLEHLKESFASVRGDGLHVVIDCGNGAASLVAKAALEQMGCRVTGLYCELDGQFPNHHPDPTVVENLQDLISTVKNVGADVGIGFDGDADRIGTVDERGNILWGDRLLVVYSRDVLADRPGSTIISEVKASQSLYDDIQRRGGRPIMWKTGHSLIKAKMKEESAALAGEMSGHMFFADRYFGYDDAVYAACRLVEILAKTGKSLSALTADLPDTAVTPEIRVDCDDHLKFELVKRVQRRFQDIGGSNSSPRDPRLAIRQVVTLDGVRVILDDGWGLIRASNTQPALVLRFEASTPERLQVTRAFLETELEEAKRSMTR